MKRLVKAVLVGWAAVLLVCGGIDSLFALGTGRQPESSTPQKPVQSVSAAEATPAGGASLSGKAALSGKAPAAEKIQMAADPVCVQQHKQDAFKQEVVSKNGTLQYVLVYIKEGAQENHPVPAQPVTLNQVGCVYEPHVFGIQVGQKLEVLNSDPTLHNINCQPKANKKFNIAQPVKGMKTTKTFDKPEIGVSFKCNVHPWMAAYGGVFSHPFYAVTDGQGAFSIKGLSAGTYTIEAWHEKLGTQTQKVTLTEGESKEVSFVFQSK